MTARDRIGLAGAVGCCLIAGLLSATQANAVIIFVMSGIALSLLALLVGQATEQIGARLGPAATGILQSALGNLPELFVSIFALRAGYVAVVQATIIGSVLGNSLFVLGIAFFVGGVRHGTQRFASEPPRQIAALTILAVAALAIPTLVHVLHTPASAYASGALSIACAIVLLISFIASVPFALTNDITDVDVGTVTWSMRTAIIVLIIAGIGSVVVSDWFVNALGPAIAVLHLSQTFTGLIVVALAGNAVENVVGIQLAAGNKSDFAVSVILNSSLQVAVGLTPILVLISYAVSATHLSLVMPPMLVASLGLATMCSVVVVYDGESTWLEGIVLVGLYVIIAAAFWWG